ncbi:MAG: Holliday junction branch migration protein RuvA [Gammaproteobacteria bacterium]|nr:Holliday junction branch migration protein RuvA [Gammaproteobacteria bacterium]
MIGRIRGILLEKRPPRVLVDCQGVGYEIEASMTTLWALPEINHEVTLHTQLIVREDAHLLFGFATVAERQMFQSLLKVNGVGAKMALGILSGIQADEFVVCIQRGDTARLTGLPGIGKKTAERLIVEMRDRVADWAGLDGGISTSPKVGVEPDAVADAVSGLIALGYKPHEASKLIHTLDATDKTSEALIREALRGIAKAQSG